MSNKSVRPVPVTLFIADYLEYDGVTEEMIANLLRPYGLEVEEAIDLKTKTVDGAEFPEPHVCAGEVAKISSAVNPVVIISMSWHNSELAKLAVDGKILLIHHHTLSGDDDEGDEQFTASFMSLDDEHLDIVLPRWSEGWFLNAPRYVLIMPPNEIGEAARITAMVREHTGMECVVIEFVAIRPSGEFYPEFDLMQLRRALDPHGLPTIVYQARTTGGPDRRAGPYLWLDDTDGGHRVCFYIDGKGGWYADDDKPGLDVVEGFRQWQQYHVDEAARRKQKLLERERPK